MLTISRFTKATTLARQSSLFRMFLVVLTGCVIQPAPDTSIGAAGSLLVSVVESAGSPPKAAINAYLAEDLRVTSEIVGQGRAGAWTDSTGVANLGAWRPGNYTLVVRAPGFIEERRALSIRAGMVDTVRVVVKRQSILLQE